MKRTILIILAVFALVVPSVFASSLEIGVSAIPYQMQYLVDYESPSTADRPYESVRGFGSFAGLRYVFDSGFSAGVEMEIDSVSYIDVAETTFADFAIMGKIGLVTPIDARIGFDMSAAAGIDFKGWDYEDRVYATGKLNLGIRLKCSNRNDGISINFGGMFKADFKTSERVNYALAPYFGIDYRI